MLCKFCYMMLFVVLCYFVVWCYFVIFVILCCIMLYYVTFYAMAFDVIFYVVILLLCNLNRSKLTRFWNALLSIVRIWLLCRFKILNFDSPLNIPVFMFSIDETDDRSLGDAVFRVWGISMASSVFLCSLCYSFMLNNRGLLIVYL